MVDTIRTTVELSDGSALDEWTTISGALSNDHSLRESIAVHIYVEGDELVATYEDPIPINAFGATREEALTQLREELVEHLAWLEDAGDALAPRLVRQPERLY